MYKFPSPYGESFRKLIEKITLTREILHEFPSPYGDSLNNTIKKGFVINFSCETLFPPPCGESFRNELLEWCIDNGWIEKFPSPYGESFRKLFLFLYDY